jgi:hypothetical protein
VGRWGRGGERGEGKEIVGPVVGMKEKYEESWRNMKEVGCGRSRHE